MDRELPTLASERLTLRSTREDDVPALVEMLNEPEVRHWWGENDTARVRGAIEAQPCWTIVVGGDVAGWMHVHEESTEEHPSVAFDIAMSASARGRGLGAAALRLAIRHFIACGHHRFSIDPAVENARAIRSYASVGFKPVGVLRAYERAPDGSWRNGMLMDLLAHELIDA